MLSEVSDFAVEEFGQAVALLGAILEGGGELGALPYVERS